MTPHLSLAAIACAAAIAALPPQDTAAQRWTIATQGADGVVRVQEVDGPKISTDDEAVLTYGLAVRTGPAAPGADLRKDGQAVLRAAEILAARGYGDEANRLAEIVGELDRRADAKDLDARAEKLLEKDLGSKAARVEMLDTIADTYELAGWESNSAAMRWMAELGRAQIKGEDQITQPLPKAIAESGAPGMAGVIRIVRQAAEVSKSVEAERVAELSQRLAAFYELRASGRLDGAMNPPERSDLATREQALLQRIEALQAELDALRTELSGAGGGNE
ncbi:MAG: hypothetical protein AAF726_12025 [Planctomycetota bacterium]